MKTETSPQSRGPSDWWVCNAMGSVSGPMSTELLLEWIRTGVVTSRSLVCRVGSSDWVALTDVPSFERVWDERPRRFDRDRERAMVDLESLPPEQDASAESDVPPSSDAFDPASEVTAVAVPRPTPAPERARGRARLDVESNE